MNTPMGMKRKKAMTETMMMTMTETMMIMVKNMERKRLTLSGWKWTRFVMIFVAA